MASREGALVVNNVMLSAILAVVLLGTLYPLLTEAFDVRVSVGPPYFNPVSAIFAFPMFAVMAVGPLLRWRKDRWQRINAQLVVLAALGLAALIALALFFEMSVLALGGFVFAAVLAVASFLPLKGRKLARTPLSVWGMVLAHFGVAVALFGMASEAAFTKERLAALSPTQVTDVGPWQVRLASVDPMAGPNWTALSAQLEASYRGNLPETITPQSRNFWAPAQQTTESVLLTRWNGQLYAVLGGQSDDGRWQVRLWWKPFVTFIWYGGLLIALGGALSLVSRVAQDVKRRTVRRKAAERRERPRRHWHELAHVAALPRILRLPRAGRLSADAAEGRLRAQRHGWP